MFNSGNGIQDELTKKTKKYIEMILIILGIIIACSFIIEFVKDFITKPTDLVLMGEEMESHYAPIFENYADFNFDEETEKFTLEMTDSETIENLIYLAQYDEVIGDDYGWDVIVENMVLLSLEIEKETGYVYDFEIIDPTDEKKIILSISDGEILYNKFPY